MKLLKLGVVGCGWAGQQAIKAAQASSLVDVVAVADLDEPRRSRVASEEGVPRQYGPYQDLLADDQVQAVLLAVNPPVRYPMVVDAFAAGKHVLVQKPHAVRAAHILEFEAAAERAGTHAAILLLHAPLSPQPQIARRSTRGLYRRAVPRPHFPQIQFAPAGRQL